MKVLLITFDFPPIVSGISTVFYNIGRFLPAEEFVILAPAMPGSSRYDQSLPFKVYRKWFPLGDNIIKKFLRTVLLFMHCYLIKRREKIRMIICGQPVIIGLAGFVFYKMFRIPYQVWVYGGEVAKFERNTLLVSAIKKITACSFSVVANSRFSSKVYQDFGIPASKIMTILPGVDIDVFKPGIPTEALAARYGLRDKHVLLTVARLSMRKGHDVVIQALHEVRQKVPAVVYLIVGGGPDEQRLRRMVKKYRLEDCVIFTGFVDEKDLPALYNLCDIYVMPNRQVQGIDTLEGFGVSFIEAGACAKPVIAGASGGSCEAVVDTETGFLVDPLDSSAVAEKIMFLLLNKEKARIMGERARARAVASFQWQQRGALVQKSLQSKLLLSSRRAYGGLGSRV